MCSDTKSVDNLKVGCSLLSAGDHSAVSGESRISWITFQSHTPSQISQRKLSLATFCLLPIEMALNDLKPGLFHFMSVWIYNFLFKKLHLASLSSKRCIVMEPNEDGGQLQFSV